MNAIHQILRLDTGSSHLPRWVLAAFVVALLALLAGGAWFFQTEKSTARQQAQLRFAAIGRLKVDQIVAWRSRCLDDAAQLSESPFLVEGVARFLNDPATSNAEKLRNRFRSLAIHGHYADVLLVGLDGRTLFSLRENVAPHQCYPPLLAESLRLGRPLFSDLHSESHHPAPHLSIAAPIFADNQAMTPLGAIVLVSDAASFLYPLIQSWPMPSTTAETLLVRRDGDHVLFLNDLRHQAGAALKLRIPLGRTDSIAAMAALGRQGFVEGTDYGGGKRVAVILPIPGSTWFLIAEDDADQVYASWRHRAAMILALLAALTGGLGAIGFVMRQYQQKAYYQTLYSTEARLRASVQRQSITLRAIGDGVIATDAQGRVELLNPVAEALTGWPQAEAMGRPLEEIFYIVNENTRERLENPVDMVLRGGMVVGLANHSLLVARNGMERAIADSAAPIHDEQGRITGVVMVFRDQSEERRAQRLIRSRLVLLDYAADHGLDEFLARALDEIGSLVASPIGFYHFVAADQQGLVMQQWSTRTRQEFCRAEGQGRHYHIDQAGAWADAARQKQPVIHNHYPSLAGKKGLPPGHAEVIRELVVPVLRAGKVVALLGVGNKPEEYTQADVENVSYLADITWHIVERKLTEESLRESEVRFRAIYDSIPVGIAQVSLDFHVQHANPAYCRFLGYREEELIGKHLREFADPEIIEKNLRQQEQLVRGEIDQYSMEKRFLRKDGQVVQGKMTATLVRDAQGKPAYSLGSVVDTTEQKRAEEEQQRLQDQLHQVQKMESMGRLAGGVAHDFNNMLGVILGYTEMAMEEVSPSSPFHARLDEIFKAAKRSANLTRQLLAFARKQTIAPRVLDLNATVEGMLNMLRRLIGEDIDLAWRPGREVWPVNMDPSQLDQLLANLCVNARDAIAGVGKITIETGAVTFDEAYCAEHPGFFPGDFVRLAVSDDGCGMDKETQEKLFEPFFTTKGLGKGTGLGLATVYGIVKQNNGFVNVYSEPGQGATFKIYLPRYTGEAGELHGTTTATAPEAHGETVLLVEDELAILRLSKTMLTKLGYNVLAASNPEEALQLAGSHQGPIHLLLTDIVMPTMNGRELSVKVQALRPEIKTLFMSGYTADFIAHRGVLEQGVCFIQKPFSLADLATKIRETLQEKRGGNSEANPVA